MVHGFACVPAPNPPRRGLPRSPDGPAPQLHPFTGPDGAGGHAIHGYGEGVEEDDLINIPCGADMECKPTDAASEVRRTRGWPLVRLAVTAELRGSAP